MYKRRTNVKSKGGEFRASVDVTSAMDDFSKGVANSTVLKGAAVAANKKHLLPQLVSIYGGAMGGPKKVTGALAQKSTSGVKGIWYKRSKTGVAVVGVKTNKTVTKSLKLSKAHKMERWHANLLEQGHKNMYRVAPGRSVHDPSGQRTILNNSPWRIHDAVRLDTKQLKRKVQKKITVTRKPSKYAHLIEKGHRFPKGGRAKAYRPVEKTIKAKGKASQLAMMNEIRKRATKAAKRAEKKAMRKVADTHNLTRG